MYSEDELVELAATRESDLVERKESWRADEAIRQTACALANDLPGNDKPGVIFVGLRDNGNPVGIDVNDELLLRLGEVRSDGSIVPQPRIELKVLSYRSHEIAAVIVHPHFSPPLRYKGRVYVRIGPRTQVASAEEERVLIERQRGRNLPFDTQPFPGTSLTELLISEICEQYIPAAIAPDVLAANGRTLEERCKSLRILSQDNYATIGALICFSPDPESFVPGAYIQFNRFDGTRLTDPIQDSKRLSGPIWTVLSGLDDLMRLNIATAVNINEDVEVRKAEYSIVALQQVVRNAVMHRDYRSNAPIRINWFSDRIEISNPGGLFGMVNESNFGTGMTDYRNPLVAEAMRVFGYVQRFGVGIPTAVEESIKNGNPRPEFEFSPASVLARIKKA